MNSRLWIIITRVFWSLDYGWLIREIPILYKRSLASLLPGQSEPLDGIIFYIKTCSLAIWKSAFKEELGLVCIEAKQQNSDPLSFWRDSLPQLYFFSSLSFASSVFCTYFLSPFVYKRKKNRLGLPLPTLQFFLVNWTIGYFQHPQSSKLVSPGLCNYGNQKFLLQ